MFRNKDKAEAEVETLKQMNAEISASNADHVKWYREIDAENERLKAEVQHLITTHGEGCEEALLEVQQERDEAEAEVERLKAGIEATANHRAKVEQERDDLRDLCGRLAGVLEKFFKRECGHDPDHPYDDSGPSAGTLILAVALLAKAREKGIGRCQVAGCERPRAAHSHFCSECRTKTGEPTA